MFEQHPELSQEIMDVFDRMNWPFMQIEDKAIGDFIQYVTENPGVLKTHGVDDLLMPQELRKYLSDRLIAICDISSFWTRAKDHYDAQKLEQTKQFFVDLIRQAENIGERVQKNSLTDNKSPKIVIKIGKDCFFDAHKLVSFFENKKTRNNQ